MLKSGIYKIQNIITNKLYIGSAVYLKARFSQHKSLLKANKHVNRYLQAAWNKYGKDNFKFVILEFCGKDVLLIREQIYLNWFKASNREFGYNLNYLSTSRLGTPQPKAMVARMSENFKGFNHKEETKLKISTSMKLVRTNMKAKYSISMIGNDRGRNYKKWPHEKGSKCKCKDCKYIRNQDNYNLLKQKVA